MSSLFVSGSVNISGTYKINGEDIATEKFNNKITGDLEFLENKVMHGSISGSKEDGTHILKLKSEKVVVDGALEVDGDPYRGPLSVTTAEQATGEKFLGREVYIKGWEGEVPVGNMVSSFFPNPNCCIVSYGSDTTREIATDRTPISYIHEQDVFRRDANLGLYFNSTRRPWVRVWVKYTHE
jgi:hypothetical protein